MPLSALQARHCLITGASRGIGAAIARRLASEGAVCTLVGRNRSTLEEVLRSLPSASAPHRHVQGDVGDRAFWDELAREVKDVHTLVNAAGVSQYSLLVATGVERLEEVVRTNLMGSMLGCKSMVRGMIRRKEGCIINIGSLLGSKGGKGSVGYAASKASILGLTRSLAAEVGPLNIRVNAILPGYIETQMTESMTPEARYQAINAIPLKRFGAVEEVADAAIFLTRNEYASNCVLNIDGGLSAT